MDSRGYIPLSFKPFLVFITVFHLRSFCTRRGTRDTTSGELHKSARLGTSWLSWIFGRWVDGHFYDRAYSSTIRRRFRDSSSLEDLRSKPPSCSLPHLLTSLLSLAFRDLRIALMKFRLITSVWVQRFRDFDVIRLFTRDRYWPLQCLIYDVKNIACAVSAQRRPPLQVKSRSRPSQFCLITYCAAELLDIEAQAQMRTSVVNHVTLIDAISRVICLCS